MFKRLIIAAALTLGASHAQAHGPITMFQCPEDPNHYYCHVVGTYPTPEDCRTEIDYILRPRWNYFWTSVTAPDQGTFVCTRKTVWPLAR